MSVLVGVDVGGTFTDVVVAVAGALHTAKVPTSPADQSEGVMAGVAAALEAAGSSPHEVTELAHGMTVATNALLEGRAARAALVATAGFTDLVELGRQDRPELYRLCTPRPAPLVGPELRFAAAERMGPDGPLRALRPEAVDALVAELSAADPEAVAVVLLHSYRHPAHELALRDAISAGLPGVHVSLSHEVVGTFREYERAATTEVDAALSPLVARYLRALRDRAAAAGLPEPAVMQSSGGLADLELAAAHAALTVLSGPAAGAAGAAHVAAAAGEGDALCFDMGGTSCDVCVVEGGRVSEASGREVAGRPIALPMLDLHTVGAGGGSVAWRDAGGALRVGPQSAGAVPGPACYGRGGAEPTVTDAALVLGHIAAGSKFGGSVELNAEAARGAVAILGAELGLDEVACAEGIARVAAAEMARALRVVTVQRGVDPRRFCLLAFGGAGPMHAAAVADELGLDRILCPPASGVLAALGLVVSERRRDAQRSVLLGGADLHAATVTREWQELATRARSALGDEGAALRTTYELRYRGQAFELAVELEGGPAGPEALRDKFAATHEARYGYRDEGADVELVALRVTAAAPGPEVDLTHGAGDATAPQASRQAVFGGQWLAADVWRRTPAPGAAIHGPAICELASSTLVVPPGWRGTGHATGAVALERSA